MALVITSGVGVEVVEDYFMSEDWAGLMFSLGCHGEG